MKSAGDARKIIFVNRFFYPDHSATSQILSDLVFHLAGDGRRVHVVTSRQRYDDPRARLPAEETIQGVKVHRVFTTRFGRSVLSGRAVDYLSFYVSAMWRLGALAAKNDIVVAKTDPPLLSVALAPVVRLRRAKLVTWLQDLFPEIASALGVRLLQGRWGRWIGTLRDASLRAAVMNVVLGERERTVLVQRGVPENRIRMIHNWSDDASIRPVSPQRNQLRHAWRLQGKFVVEYSGNLGRAHDVDTVLEAAALLNRTSDDAAEQDEADRCSGALRRSRLSRRSDALEDGPDAVPPVEELTDSHASEVVFLFIGGGHRYQWLRSQAAQRGLNNTMFQPYQSRERLAESLGVGDVHLISPLPEVEGLIVPSKFYGIAAAGRPMVFIGDADGEIARLLREGQCGVTVAPGDARSLAAWIVRLQDQPDIGQRWGKNARQLLDDRFTRKKAFESWAALLEGQEQ